MEGSVGKGDEGWVVVEERLGRDGSRVRRKAVGCKQLGSD